MTPHPPPSYYDDEIQTTMVTRTRTTKKWRRGWAGAAILSHSHPSYPSSSRRWEGWRLHGDDFEDNNDLITRMRNAWWWNKDDNDEKNDDSTSSFDLLSMAWQQWRCHINDNDSSFIWKTFFFLIFQNRWTNDGWVGDYNSKCRPIIFSNKKKKLWSIKKVTHILNLINGLELVHNCKHTHMTLTIIT